jgi:hypothetical protein
MKIKAGTVLKFLDGTPIMIDQEVVIDAGKEKRVNGRPQTAGDVIAAILSTKKTEKFNTLKAYALAQRFYRADTVDLDEADYQALREVIEGNDQYVPLVTAQIIQVMIDAKEKTERKK